MQCLLAGCLVVALASCATVDPEQRCDLPPLTDDEVRRVANEFLMHEHMNPAFRASAETRVEAVGCLYLYEEAEKLDSFGVGVVVEIDRRRHVVDFRSSH
jgi:hypothetical protein